MRNRLQAETRKWLYNHVIYKTITLNHFKQFIDKNKQEKSKIVIIRALQLDLICLVPEYMVQQKAVAFEKQ